MALNENKTKGKWLEIKGEVLKVWEKLTDDDLEKTKGDIKSISGLIQQKYGDAQKDYAKKLTGIFKNIEAKKDEVVDQVKKTLKK
jgi:uncharacterized protein YjbJ (UPF0337 family)